MNTSRVSQPRGLVKACAILTLLFSQISCARLHHLEGCFHIHLFLMYIIPLKILWFLYNFLLLRSENWRSREKQIQRESGAAIQRHSTSVHHQNSQHHQTLLAGTGSCCWQGRLEASTPPSEDPPTARSVRSPRGALPISSNNLNCLDNSSDSTAVWETRSSHCFSGYPPPPDTLRPQNPTWHHRRRMLRHCGTRPPPRHLGRTLGAQQSAECLPWLPLPSDSSCTDTLQLC